MEEVIKPKRKYYTITGKTDGFGAQYQAVMSGIAICNYKNIIYVHTPFNKIEHKVNVKKLNEFIGISNKELKESGLFPKNPQNITKEDFNRKVHFHNTPSIFYTDNVLKIIRDYYYSTEKPSIGCIDIAIHIRRGDVNKNTMHRKISRYTDNSCYIKIIEGLKNKYPGQTITVFSEGRYENFKDLGLDEGCFQLNTDIMETFHSLVSAKILVMCVSSFSYSAALLNKNIIYYQDFWHKPLDHWISINSLIESSES
jgi:hypothetical protein